MNDCGTGALKILPPLRPLRIAPESFLIAGRPDGSGPLDFRFLNAE